MIRVGIVGATGYAGAQIVWLLQQHPRVDIQFVTSTSYSERDFSEVYPSQKNFFQHRLLEVNQISDFLPHIELLFIALPHGMSESIAYQALCHDVKVIDLGADFRLDDPDVYQQWYQVTPKYPHLTELAVYGLPEINAQQIKYSQLVACPGCYPTCSILALAPLLKETRLKPKVIIDAKSGISGAGRRSDQSFLFCEVNENIKAYSLFKHRHTAEIQQELNKLSAQDVQVIFTPHLVPMNRGILTTIYLDLSEEDHGRDESYFYQLYQDYYQHCPFIRITPYLPEIKFVKNSNLCDIGLRYQQDSGMLIIVGAIDNLIKGAAGQAIQNMNLMCNFPVDDGLKALSMYL